MQERETKQQTKHIYLDAAEPITLGQRWMETPEQEQRQSEGSHYFSVSKNLLNMPVLDLGF